MNHPLSAQPHEKELRTRILDLVYSHLSATQQRRFDHQKVTATISQILGLVLKLSEEPIFEEEEPPSLNRDPPSHSEEISKQKGRDFTRNKIRDLSMNKISFQAEEDLQDIMFGELVQHELQVSSSNLISKKASPQPDLFEATDREVKEEDLHSLVGSISPYLEFEDEAQPRGTPQRRRITRSLAKTMKRKYSQSEYEMESGSEQESSRIEVESELSESFPQNSRTTTLKKKERVFNSDGKPLRVGYNLKTAKKDKRYKTAVIEKRRDLHSQSKFPHGRRPANPCMQSRLVIWINMVLEKGFKLTQTEIRSKARKLTREIGGSTQFAASKGWMEKFFRRHTDIAQRVLENNKCRIDELDDSDFDKDRQRQTHRPQNSPVKEEDQENHFHLE